MLKQGDVVEYDNGVIYGVGEIVGIALIEQPMIGITWIVHDLSGNVPNDVYEFDNFVCFDCHLEKV